MIRIDANTLNLCRQQLDDLNCWGTIAIVRAYGPLSPWWLKPELLDKAAKCQPAYNRYCKTPELPSSIGSCWAILACIENLPLLRSAILLPLCWKQNAPQMEERLPSPLKSLVKTVLRQQQLEHSSWNLTLHPECGLADLDLSQLNSELAWESAWASLAGGLFLATKGLQPSSKIWASIAHDPIYGIRKVNDVAKKLELAADYGVERFFLPEVNRENHSISSIVRYIPGNSDRSQQIDFLLRDYLQAIGLEPTHGPLETRKEFYQTADRERAEAFYLANLVTELATKCVNQVRKDYPSFKSAHLVSIIGEYPSPTALACELLQQLTQEVKSVFLLLHTGTPAIQKVMTQIKNKYSNVIDRKIENNQRVSEVDQIKAILDDIFPSEVQHESIAFDLTPGFKSLSLALMEAAPVGSWFLYCRHNRDDAKNRAIVGTESYDCWQKK